MVSAGDMGAMSFLVITFTGIQGNRGTASNSLPASLNRARNLAVMTLPDHMPKDIDLCLVLGGVGNRRMLRRAVDTGVFGV